MNTVGKHGLILFGHGSREPSWAEPMMRVAEKLAVAHGNAGPVGLAFLEWMSPDLPAAVHAQAAAGCDAITIVALFFGQGSHLRRNLAALVAQCKAACPTVRIHCANAVGEDDAVQDAIVQYCLAHT
jgi:sirohydrochlorin cobaltochelatase